MPLIKKVRFFIRFVSAIWKKQFKNILIGLFLGIVFYFFLAFFYVYLPKPQTKIKIGKVGKYTINEIPEEILKDLSYGLISLSEKGEILPSIAESWSIENDGKTYIFKIKPQSFFWHDKDPLSPTDINYNFKEVEYRVDNYNIVFNLKEPFSPFLSVIAKPVFKKGLVGLGPYKISKIEKQNNFIKSILLVPSGNANKKLPHKIYRFYSNENDLKTAFNLGEINYLDNLFELEGLNLNNNVKIIENIRKDAYLALIINNSKPFLETKSFRQALAYAIEKDQGEKRALGPINPLSWAYNPDVKPYLKDIKRSLSLLEKDHSENKIIINISSFPQFEKLARTIKNSWEEIGLKAEIHITTHIPSDFDVLLVARETPLEPDQYFFWHTTQKGNIGNFKNPRIDKLLEDGRKTVDQNKRKDIYYDFQRFLSEEVPAIFLSHPITYSVRRNSIFLNN